MIDKLGPHTLTLEEQEKILIVAEGLIREPENWITGKWKCPVIKDDKHAEDVNGEKLYQYCVEGAVNEAAIQVVGLERLHKEFGVVNPDPSQEGYYYFSPEVIARTGAEDLTDLLGLDDIAFKFHGEELNWVSRKDALGALGYNDSRRSSPLKEDMREIHEGVLNILRTGLKNVRKRIKAQKK